MLILGLQGSPRRGGNTDILLAAFMEKAARAGAAVKTIQAARAGVTACIGCGHCETHGTCVIADDPMSAEIYGLLREADVVVAASPVFFYGVTAQLKLLIDRSQTLWSRKYRLKLKDPLARTRKGLLLSVAASHGRQLFEGVHLTTAYFFDAIDAQFDHTLTYRGIESKGAVRQQEGLAADIDAAVATIVLPQVNRKKVLFLSAEGACRSPMAAALAQQRYGELVRTGAGAPRPAPEWSAPMVRSMQRIGVDMGYRRPHAADQALYGDRPDLTVILGEDVEEIPTSASPTVRWSIPKPTAADDESMEQTRRQIETQLETLMQRFA
ncbi:MAG: NAD(P)H-dependent oxidoreductase [Desulfosarcina sp.]